MDQLLLHRLDLKSLKLLIEDLTQVHDHGLVDLLPQMGSEQLDVRDLQGGQLSVHEDTRQIELDLETDVDLSRGYKDELV